MSPPSNGPPSAALIKLRCSHGFTLQQAAHDPYVIEEEGERRNSWEQIGCLRGEQAAKVKLAKRGKQGTSARRHLSLENQPCRPALPPINETTVKKTRKNNAFSQPRSQAERSMLQPTAPFPAYPLFLNPSRFSPPPSPCFYSPPIVPLPTHPLELSC
eukprot:1363829-Rhodomonas_salina.6